MIKEYFANYFLHSSDVTFDMANNKMQVHQQHAEPWRVTLVDTGELSMTGGRLKRVRHYLDEQDFCMTYGDGVADVDIPALIKHHRTQKTLATVTAVQPPGRFGVLELDDTSRVQGFAEKPQGEGGWINGGFFVLSPKAIDYIEADETYWEIEPMQQLSKEGQLNAYKHHGFWQPMDTLREKRHLEDLWASGRAPWKIWK
jgi:glucose-1-phosphate cytidylyltransferase